MILKNAIVKVGVAATDSAKHQVITQVILPAYSTKGRGEVVIDGRLGNQLNGVWCRTVFIIVMEAHRGLRMMT